MEKTNIVISTMTKNEFNDFKSDVLKELSELIKITGDPFLMRTKRSVENDRYNDDINEVCTFWRKSFRMR